MSSSDLPPESTPSGAQYLAVQASPEFQELRSRLRRFVFPTTAFFLAWYFLYVLLAAFAPGFMSTRVVGNINIGLIFGLLQMPLEVPQLTWQGWPVSTLLLLGGVALGVVLAAGGYPGDYAKGDVIEGLDEAAKLDGKVFHAGTALKDGQVVTSGGRVLCATAIGESVSAAQQQAYRLAEKIRWNGCFYRKDIAWRALKPS